MHVERLVTSLRQSLAIGGLPNGHDLQQLLSHCGLRVRRSPYAPGPSLAALPGDGPVLLTLPTEMDERDYEGAVLHECGHRLLSSGPGIGLFPRTRNGCRTERADEAEVERFVRAWKLPVDCLSDYADEELAGLSGLSLEEVRLRRREVLRF